MPEETETIRPTKKQKELLGFIADFITEHGYSPSYREIMNGLNYTSVATVALHVNNLITRGHLRKRDHSARSLEIVEAAEVPKPLKSNEVKPGEEKWLVEKVEYFFDNAEKAGQPEASKIDELYVLIGTLKILGLEGAAQSFIPRLSELKKKLG
jgi:SOS-response transcriptional repressor LexA